MFMSAMVKNIFMRGKMEFMIPRGDSRVKWKVPSFTEYKTNTYVSYMCINCSKIIKIQPKSAKNDLVNY